jgi:hypothetical protein
VSGLTKSFGDVKAVDDLSFSVDPGSITGFLGPNGAGKTDDAADAARPGRPGRGQRHDRRSQRCGAAGAERRGRSGARGVGLSSGTQRPRSPARLLRRQRLSRRARRRGPGPGRADRGGPPPGGRLLAGDAPAARVGRCARGPGGAGARRAGQRPRPGGHRVDAPTPARAGRGGPHGAGVEPRALRGAAARRSRRDHQPRAARPARARSPSSPTPTPRPSRSAPHSQRSWRSR